MASYDTIIPSDLQSKDFAFSEGKSNYGKFINLNMKFTTPALTTAWTCKIVHFGGTSASCNLALRMNNESFTSWMESMEEELTGIVRRLTETNKSVALLKPPYKPGYDKLFISCLDFDANDNITTPIFDSKGNICTRLEEGHIVEADVTLKYIFIGKNGTTSVKAQANKVTIMN